MNGRSGTVSRRPSAGWRARSCGRSICRGRDRLIRNPIRKVLSSMQAHGVRALLMGGQACVFYGAAEFSRDADLLILADPENLDRLRAALKELEATRTFVPELTEEFLRRGHAV